MSSVEAAHGSFLRQGDVDIWEKLYYSTELSMENNHVHCFQSLKHMLWNLLQPLQFVLFLLGAVLFRQQNKVLLTFHS